MALAGLCAVADWIGSQAEYFGYHAAPRALGEYYDVVARPAAEKAWRDLALRTATPSGAGFATLFPGKTPRDVQRAVEALALPVGPALFVIEARMGSGKTESVLALAERLLGRGDATGIYIGLPTMATSNGMFDRLADVAPLLFDGSPSLVLAHGRRWLHHGFMWMLIGFAVHHVYSAVLMSQVEANATVESIFSGYKFVPREDLVFSGYRFIDRKDHHAG